MEALNTPALKAAEYIRAPKSVDGAVELEAGLLIQRAGRTSGPSESCRCVPTAQRSAGAT